jgi:hypothetical protein
MFYGNPMKLYFTMQEQQEQHKHTKHHTTINPGLWRGSSFPHTREKRSTHNTGCCNHHGRFFFSNASIDRQANSN